MSEESEALFNKVNIFDKIHKKASKHSNLKTKLQEYIKNVQNLLYSCSEKLILKNHYFKYYNIVSKYNINNLFQVLKILFNLI